MGKQQKRQRQAAAFLSSWQGAAVYPFTTQNAWTSFDAGQVILLSSPIGSLVNPAALAGYISSTSGGSGGSQLTVSFGALLPVDGGQ